METIEGIVQAVSVKEESGTYGIRVNNRWFNGFLPCPTKKGQKVKIEFEKSGRWNNITTLKVTEEYLEGKDIQEHIESKPYVTKYTSEELVQIMEDFMQESKRILVKTMGSEEVVNCEQITQTGNSLFKAMVWQGAAKNYS